jgi:nicotinamidase-related amidase
MTLNAGKSALLLIDIQQAMFGPEFVCREPERLLGNVADLLARAREAGTPVLHVQHGEQNGPFAQGSAGWRIHPAAAPREDEPVIGKLSCSAFYKTDLDERLGVAGVGRLVIAGLQTEFCVDTACRVAQSLGYAVTLVSDGHSTFDNPILSAGKIIEHHNRALSIVVEHVIPAAEVMF